MCSTASTTSAAVMPAIGRPFQRGRASFSRMRLVSSAERRPLRFCAAMKRASTFSKLWSGAGFGWRLSRARVTLSAVGSWPSETIRSVSRAASRASPKRQARVGAER